LLSWVCAILSANSFSKNNEYQQEFLPKLSDAIVYSTIKAKNNSDGLVEKIINVLEKIKK
jgi:hypothetical protein